MNFPVHKNGLQVISLFAVSIDSHVYSVPRYAGRNYGFSEVIFPNTVCRVLIFMFNVVAAGTEPFVYSSRNRVVAVSSFAFTLSFFFFSLWTSSPYRHTQHTTQTAYIHNAHTHSHKIDTNIVNPMTHFISSS